MSEVTQVKPREKIKKAEDELALQDFGRELRRLRKLRGLTQKTLYEITGVDDTVISDMERGTYTPSLALIKELSDGLQINPHVLVAAYYGIPLPEFNVTDKETLESLIRIALDYAASQHQPLLPLTEDKSPIPAKRHPIDQVQKEIGLADARAQRSRRKANKNLPQPVDTPEDNL